MATIKGITAKYGKTHDERATYFYPLKQAGLIDEELQAVFDASHLEDELAKETELKTASDYSELEPVFDAKAEILKLQEANITLMDKIDKLKAE